MKRSLPVFATIFTNLFLLLNCEERNFRVSLPFKRENQSEPEYFTGFASFKMKEKSKEMDFKIILKNREIGNITKGMFEIIQGHVEFDVTGEIQNPIKITHTSNSFTSNSKKEIYANFKFREKRNHFKAELTRISGGFTIKNELTVLSPSSTFQFSLQAFPVNLTDLEEVTFIKMNSIQMIFFPLICLSFYFMDTNPEAKNSGLPFFTLSMFTILCFTLGYLTVFTCSDIMGKANSCHITYSWGISGAISLIFLVKKFKLQCSVKVKPALIFLVFISFFTFCLSNLDYLVWCLFIAFISLGNEIFEMKRRNSCFLTFILLACQSITYFYIYFYEFNSALIPNNSEISDYLYCVIGVAVMALGSIFTLVFRDEKIVRKETEKIDIEEDLNNGLFYL